MSIKNPITDQMLVDMVKKLHPGHAARLEWTRFRKHADGRFIDPQPRGHFLVLTISGDDGQQKYGIATTTRPNLVLARARCRRIIFDDIAHDLAKCTCRQRGLRCPAAAKAEAALVLS